jgi:hypothetical protein
VFGKAEVVTLEMRGSLDLKTSGGRYSLGECCFEFACICRIREVLEDNFIETSDWKQTQRSS